ncbi:MAG: DUF342 domain-containing protein [Planctomycetota bacterium]|jgi:uncharacterized protein (DUF342 family)
MNSDPEHPAIEVKIDEGASAAKVVIPDGFDPARLEVTLLAKLVQKRGIAIDSAVETQLLKIIETFRHEPKRLEQVIARSTAPVDGQDGTLEWMKGFDPTAGPAAAATQDDSGAVDYYNQVSYVGVAEGTHVATLHEPTPGEDGRDVTGRTIKAKPGRRYDVKLDPSLDVDASGRVIAQVDGILEYEHGVLKVNRLFEIRGAVDFGTGNVDFDGTVIVREGIRDRFKLKATEDIIVDGLIEAATINCGRNFSCHQGMAGKGRGQLDVDGDAVAGYLDDVKGRVNGNLTVQRELVNCDLAIGGNLVCDKGRVIGGSVAVSGSVRVAALGSNAERATMLILAERTPEACEIERAEPLPKMSEVSVVDVLIHKAIYPGVSMKIGDVEVKFEVALKGPIKIGRDEHQRLYFREGDGSTRPLDTAAKIVDPAA